MSIRDLHSCLTIIFCALPLFTSAQSESSGYKDISPNGPYPIYIGIGGVSNISNSDLKRLQPESNGNVDKTALYGIEAKVGFSFAEKPQLFSKQLRLILEARYQSQSRSLDNNLRFAQSYFTTGIGSRWQAPIFPLMVHAQFGVIFRYQERLIVTDDQGSMSVPRRVTNLSLKNNSVDGFYGTVRLVLLDPIGTSGGLGYYLKFDVLRISKHPSFNTDASLSSVPTRDWQAAFSVGVIVPLTVRIPSVFNK
ncbi:MAG: hypothetical protein ACR2MX_11590 [Cyclobacteriaceae bacterium]